LEARHFRATVAAHRNPNDGPDFVMRCCDNRDILRIGQENGQSRGGHESTLMTPTLVLVLTYFGVAVSAVIGGALLRMPQLFSKIARHLARESQGRHRRHTGVVQTEAQS
jgi:hypothetical protein